MGPHHTDPVKLYNKSAMLVDASPSLPNKLDQGTLLCTYSITTWVLLRVVLYYSQAPV
jgi:hypothetical protein